MVDNFDERPPKHLNFKGFPDYENFAETSVRRDNLTQAEYKQIFENTLQQDYDRLKAEFDVFTSDKTNSPKEAAKMQKQLAAMRKELAENQKLQDHYNQEYKTYSPEAIEDTFKKTEGKTLDEYIEPHLTNKKDLQEKKEFYYKLAALQDKTNDPDNKEVKATIGFHESGELCMAVRFERDELGKFGFILRDGKISLPGDNYSVEQLREIAAYLHAKGISGIEIPAAMEEKLKEAVKEAFLQDVIEERPGIASNGDSAVGYDEDDEPSVVDEEGNHVSGQIPNVNDDAVEEQDENQQQQQQQQQRPRGGKSVEDILKSIDNENTNWAAKRGYQRGYDLFITRKGEGKWNRIRVMKDVNLNKNVWGYTYKVDKNGNLIPLIEMDLKYKVYRDPKSNETKADIKLHVPKNGKLHKDNAEHVAKILSESGAKYATLEGFEDTALDTLRFAFAKEKIVPVGVKLKDKIIRGLIEHARKETQQGQEILDYELNLVEQMKYNASQAGKDLNDTDQKYYDVIKTRHRIAHFEGLYRPLKERIAKKSHNDVKVEEVMGAINASVAIYKAFETSVRGNNTVDEMLEAFSKSKDGQPDAELNAIAKQFQSQNPHLIDKTLYDLTKEDIDALYGLSETKFKNDALAEMDYAYINGNINNPASYAAQLELKRGIDELKDINRRFIKYLTGDVSGTKIEDFDIVPPDAVFEVSKVKYEPNEEVEKERKAKARAARGLPETNETGTQKKQQKSNTR